jgi:hypothetical protein
MTKIVPKNRVRLKTLINSYFKSDVLDVLDFSLAATGRKMGSKIYKYI